MDITTHLNNRIYVAQNTKSAIFSMCDYISSQIEHLQSFISGEKPLGYISIPMERDYDSESLQRVTLVKYEDVVAALEDDSAQIPAIISDSGDTVTLLGSEVTNRITDTISDLKAQQCFFKYCTETASATAEGFLSRITALSDGIPGYIKEKYMNLISNTGSGLQAITAFLSTRLNEPELMEDQYITVTNFDDYNGNVWESVWTIIITDITNCFKDVVWQGILKIGDFLKSIWNGVVKLIKWGVSMLFGDLFTCFEKSSSAIQGILDLPMFQFDLGAINDTGQGVVYLTSLWTMIYTIKTSYSNLTRYSGFCNFKWNIGQLLNNNDMDIKIMESAVNLALSYDEDNNGVKSILDVPIPLDDPYLDFVIRFGFSDTGHFMMSGFFVTTMDNLNQIGSDDGDVYGYLCHAMHQVISSIGKVVPMIYSEPYYADWSFKINEQAGILNSRAGSSSSITEQEFMESIVFKYTDVGDPAFTSQNYKCAIVFQLLMYSLLMSKGFANISFSNNKVHYVADITNSVLPILYNDNCLYTPDPNGAQPETVLTSCTINLSLLNSNTYRPYMIRDVLPVTVHYQAIDERAQEIVNAFRAVVIIAVVVFVTVKLMKAKRNFNKNLMLIEAARDQASYDLSDDPTNPQLLAKFNKNYKKARKMNLFGRLLGFTSEAVASESLSIFSDTRTSADNAAVCKLIRGH